MYVAIARLDETLAEYLRRAAATRGEATDGVFCANGRFGFRGRAIFATIFLSIAGLVLFGVPAEKERVPWAVGLFAIGVAFLVSAVLLRRQWKTHGDYGTFSLLDGRYLWEMGGSGVNVVEHLGATLCHATHHYTNGVYSNTAFQLGGPGFTATFNLANHARAEEFHRYLTVLFNVREQFPDMPPNVAGAVAKRVVNGLSLDEIVTHGAIPEVRDEPELRKVPGYYAPWVALAASAALAWVGFPPLADRLYEEHRYARAIRNATADEYRSFLDEFPASGHAEEIAVKLDDLDFSEAQRISTDAHSPAGLRAYLSDARHTRHVEEAQKQINVYYEEAIARLKALAADKREAARRAATEAGEPEAGVDPINPELFEGLLGLLEWVKTQRTPVVPVAFSSRQDAALEEGPLLEFVRLSKDRYVEEHPELAGMPDGGMIGLGEVFGDEPTRTREEVILQRVRASVENVLGADVVTFERAKIGERAMLDVGYRIQPSPAVYLYTTRSGPEGLVTSTKVNGLLQGYSIGWEITLRDAAGAEHRFVVDSSPATKLNYSADDADPAWAPYAVLLLSAFYDMSNQLVSGFAVTPPAAPTHFTFRDATTDIPEGVAGGPFGNPTPIFPTDAMPDGLFDPNAPFQPPATPDDDSRVTESVDDLLRRLREPVLPRSAGESVDSPDVATPDGATTNPPKSSDQSSVEPSPVESP